MPQRCHLLWAKHGCRLARSEIAHPHLLALEALRRRLRVCVSDASKARERIQLSVRSLDMCSFC